LAVLDSHTLVVRVPYGVVAIDTATHQARRLAQGYEPLGPPTDKSSLYLMNRPSTCACYDGSVYVHTDQQNLIRRVSGQGAVETVAGTGIAGCADGPAERAEFDGIVAMTAGPAGDIYFVESNV